MAEPGAMPEPERRDASFPRIEISFSFATMEDAFAWIGDLRERLLVPEGVFTCVLPATLRFYATRREP